MLIFFSVVAFLGPIRLLCVISHADGASYYLKMLKLAIVTDFTVLFYFAVPCDFIQSHM